MEMQNKSVIVHLTVYGVFNDYYPSNNVAILYLQKNALLSDVKSAFLQDIQRNHSHLTHNAMDKINDIIESSAFSKDNQIIMHFCALEDTALSILPPVCGG